MHRRMFLQAATGLAALRPDSINRARAATTSVNDRKPEETARDEDYYSFDAGNAHFVVLESNDPVAPGGAQARFLEQDLAASAALWKIVVFHHTIYSSGTHHGSALTLRAMFTDRTEAVLSIAELN